MTWHVQYRIGATEHIGRYRTPEAAIEAACLLIEDGQDVHGIGVGELGVSIARPEIERLYAMWRAGRRHYGRD